MTLPTGCGMYLRRAYPVIPQCPWCAVKDIAPVSRGQKTCGAFACSQKQNRMMAERLKARKIAERGRK